MTPIQGLCLTVALASSSGILGINPLQLLKTIIAAVIFFCFDVVVMTFYAILAALTLVAIFLGLTACSSIFFYRNPEPAQRRFEFIARFFKITKQPQPDPPQTFSGRWILHTWDVLRIRRFFGVPPLTLFVTIAIPPILFWSLLRQRRRALQAKLDETRKCLLAEQALHKAKKICELPAQKVADLGAFFHCSLCTRLFTGPYTLAPCGHTFDFRCLKRLFRTTRDPQKLCPTCKTAVTHAPALAWSVKAIADTVADSPPDSPTQERTDPWNGMFAN
ncbi:hypothetical protein C8R43DRAFT_681706 [Mycena crocata]|nr:hypothetical protein C8R43DRAFT_681706 [Mycena crocata]